MRAENTIKPNLTERVLAVLSPKLASRRLRDRAEFSQDCKDGVRCTTTDRRDSERQRWKSKLNKNTREENRKKQTTRARIEELFEESEVISSICRDLETYVAPTGYEASTSRTEWNDQISSFIESFDCECEYRGLITFWEMLALAEVEKARSGDIGLAAIDPTGEDSARDHRYLPIQGISGCRIGNPSSGTIVDDSYYPPKFPETKRVPGIYRNGIEFEDGRAVRAHIWKLVESKPGELTPDRVEWEYDTAFTFRENFWFLSDARFIDEDRAKSEFAQCIDKITSVIYTLKSTANRLEFFSRLAGFLKGGDGDVGEGFPGQVASGSNPNCECGGTGCEKCGPKVIEMAEMLEIWGIPEGKEFDPSTFDLDAEMLLAVVEALLQSAAFCVHLPSSFVSLRGSSKGAQGTVERSDLQKAQREFMRRRRKLVKRLARPIIRAALLWGQDHKDSRLKGIPPEELIKGEFIFPPDISVDPGRDGKQLLSERTAGLLPDTLYHAKFERSPRRIRDLKNRELEQLISDVQRISGESDWKPTPREVAKFLDDRGFGEPAKAEDDSDNPDDASKGKPKDDESDDPPSDAPTPAPAG